MRHSLRRSQLLAVIAESDLKANRTRRIGFQ